MSSSDYNRKSLSNYKHFAEFMRDQEAIWTERKNADGMKTRNDTMKKNQSWKPHSQNQRCPKNIR
ncbi:hypothetical protein AA0119_g6698 [Alternaria tenuissima]|uniref:Uncharacterized protein n=1 Tax=Alternaria tenuissima TaxID=119927 RepID=A0ABY0G7M7_9PLEO|nr:hypothetical protein AA0120_g3454 [Alternaria tenuissima]RYN98930.1 hypothetical protein AA0119_g6698 [Alternaria tenuissima]RYO23044.1 hypothetical protein AA0121_g2160 [Alternaria tenuissima]